MRVKNAMIARLAIAVSALAIMSGPGWALSLQEAVSTALKTNPDILGAAENREATEFELRQARGLFLPTIDLEASAGTRLLDSPGRRRLGTEDNGLTPVDVGVTLRQPLFDGGAARSEVERQASRVDAASFRVRERSEAVALAVAQEYFEILLQHEIIALAQRNIAVHQQIVSDIGRSIEGGTLTGADRSQGLERLRAAQARLTEAEEDLVEARIRFARLVGAPPGRLKHPGSLGHAVPSSATAAVERARIASPRIAAAGADVDSAEAEIRAAQADFLPGVSLEARGRLGHDVDGSEGDLADFEARIVARWNLYRGGRDVAEVQERIRRAGEQRQNLALVHREVEETIRSAYNRRAKRAELASELQRQANINAQLVSSYRAQLRVGERSLLDVLSAQDTRFGTEVLAKTAQYASVYANYQLLATVGILADALNTGVVPQTEPYARAEFQVPPTPEVSDYERLPSRQVADDPLDLLAPLRRK